MSSSASLNTQATCQQEAGSPNKKKTRIQIEVEVEDDESLQTVVLVFKYRPLWNVHISSPAGYVDADYEISDLFKDLFKPVFDCLVADFAQLKADKNLRSFPSPESMVAIKMFGIFIEATCLVDIIPLLRNAFRFGQTSTQNSTYQDFVVDLANELVAQHDDEKALRLLRMLVATQPDCFSAWCALEKILHSQNDSTFHLEALRSAINVGIQQNRDVKLLKYNLSEREGPATNKMHAVSIAFYAKRAELQKKYPLASVVCNSKTEQIEVCLGKSVPNLPADESIKINEYDVTVKFLSDEVAKLLGRSHSPSICGGNQILR